METSAPRLEYLKQRFAKEPLATKCGMTLEKLESGFASVTYIADSDECVTNDNNQNIVQGGVLIGILADFAAVYAAMSSISGGHTPLMFGSFSLQRPTLEGEIVSAEARVFNTSRQVISVSVRILGANGKLKCEGAYHFSNSKHV